MDWNKDHPGNDVVGDRCSAERSRQVSRLCFHRSLGSERADRERRTGTKPRSRDFTEALDDTLDDYADKLDKLRTIDSGPKTAVYSGHQVVGPLLAVIACQPIRHRHGRERTGISTMAPIFEQSMQGSDGETVQFNGG